MSKIVGIECVPFEIPYVVPLRMKAGDLTSARHVLVVVRLDSGVEGIAEAPERPMFYGETVQSIVAAIGSIITPRVAALPHHSPNAVRRLLDGVRANHTARAAVELAYVDALAREHEMTVASYLGGQDVPVRVTHMLGGGPAEQVAFEAQQTASDHGIAHFKVKVGYGTQDDLATVAAVRAAVGEAALLYVDVNMAYTADDAAPLLRQLRDDYDVKWAEEPYRVDAHSLGRPPAMPIPVMADETTTSFEEAGRHIAAGRAQKISIKVARTGYGPSKEILALCKYFGCEPILGSQGDSLIGTFAGLALASARADDFGPCGELSYFTRLADDITVERPSITNGTLTNYGGLGIGVTVDPDKLSHYRIDR